MYFAPLFALALATAFFFAEKRGMFGRSLDSGILSLAAGFVFGHAFRLIASEDVSELLGPSSRWALATSLPLLLLNPKLRLLLRGTGTLVWLFHISVLGTIAGALLAYSCSLFEHQLAESVVSVMSGSYSGGTVNFMAIKEQIEMPDSTATSLYVADNLVMATIFVFLFKLRLNTRLNDYFPRKSSSDETMNGERVEGSHRRQRQFEMITICACTVVIASLGFRLASTSLLYLELNNWPRLVQNIAGSFAFWVTMVSIAVSVLIPTRFLFTSDREGLAIVLLNFYLFTVGVDAQLDSLLSLPTFVMVCGTIAFANFAATFLGAIVMKAIGKDVSLDEIVLSINAALGGPGTAAAMAVRCSDSRLVVSSTLIGVWGYAIGTVVGLTVYNALTIQ